ncbi:4'-phosphopantetheinyl transferase superfamily protein [Streptomyces uncialis]|uniref:4'-phosphopantetheinyl transferase family protein n=1 Tax=Streptomyces uncialis TaxID=1048205 RepID=UPI002E37EB53|nr:4'-phosphopantetheinyl transferase superfamily protein [Streptomyces uncialis]
MIEDLLPASVEVAESLGDPPGSELFPEEEPLVAHAVERRRREFTTGRWCARQALARLGLPQAPLLAGPRGEPLWPEGVVGSISHCAGYRVAAVASSADLLALGVDAEPVGPLPEGVLDAVTVAGERAALDGCRRMSPGVCWDRVLFSAKESVYKAWFPLTGRPLDFLDAFVRLDPVRGVFSAGLRVPGHRVGGSVVDGFTGRLAVSGGLVLTAVAVPRSANPP